MYGTTPSPHATPARRTPIRTVHRLRGVVPYNTLLVTRGGQGAQAHPHDANGPMLRFSSRPNLFVKTAQNRQRRPENSHVCHAVQKLLMAWLPPRTFANPVRNLRASPTCIALDLRAFSART